MKKIVSILFILLLSSLAMTANAPQNEAAFEANRGSRVSWVRMKFPVYGQSNHESVWDWHNHVPADLRMLQQMRQRTKINMKQEWNVVDVSKLDAMCNFPLLFFHGQRAIRLDQNAKNNIKEYVSRGGMLFIDDCVYDYENQQDLFYRSMSSVLPQIFPGLRIERLTTNHEIFSCYYKLNRYPHVQGVNNGISALYYNNRFIGVITSSDLHCAWINEWFSPKLHEQVYQMTMNIYIYCMTH
ncbi:MAG: DUF4159 domain-containing protein [Victivallaceae bacterium]